MKKYRTRSLIFITFFLLFEPISAQTVHSPPISAVAQEGENWEFTLGQRMGLEIFSSGTAYNEAKSFAEVLEANDFSVLPEWPGTESELAGYFANARDERIYKDENGFMRRSTWLYPEDGCHTRAAHIARSFESIPMPRPGKVFAFGIPLGPPLGLYSRFSRDPQKKTWWLFHVAAAYRVGQDVIVLDPAVDANQPLKIGTWLSKMARNPERAKVSICDTYSYDPASLCRGGTPDRERNSLDHQKSYFSMEWVRVLRLGLEPKEILGPHPPWAQNNLF